MWNMVDYGEFSVKSAYYLPYMLCYKQNPVVSSEFWC